MPQTINDALQSANFILDDDIYRLIRLHPRAITSAAGIIAEIGEPFCVLIVDKYEVSIVIPDEAVKDFETRLHDHQIGETYRLITIDAILEPDLIGFMAYISTALAKANVGVFPYAAFSRDHIVVPEKQAQTALEALKTLKANIS